MSLLTTVLRGVGHIPGVAACLRTLARLYAEGSVVRIRSGKAAGMHWRRHHRYVNGYWLGHYEIGLQEKVASTLKAGQTFYDVGANAGLFTILGARCVGADGRCVAFDPLPENVDSIREQVTLNQLPNVEVYQGVIAPRAGFVRVSYEALGDSQAHVCEDSAGRQLQHVPAITFDLAAQRFGAPDLVKMDIEGLEGEALEGAISLLKTARTKWIIEVHHSEAWQKVRDCLGRSHELFDLSGDRLPDIERYPFHVFAIPAKGMTDATAAS